MIGRKAEHTKKGEAQPKGFDDFALRLGDMMRGERATMGKSLLDVQRELRIKASYIAAIENCDPDAFDTPGFIAGYVRSYARYLNMNPDEAFAAFCKESGFSVAHGMSSQASVVKKVGREARGGAPLSGDVLATSGPFAPSRESFLSQVEPRAIGSTAVLVGLIALIGYGAYTVLQEVQRVQVAPVDQAPVVLSELDPLDAATNGQQNETSAFDLAESFDAPRSDALDRLYRPQALDEPVLVPRDVPIASIDPREFGNFTAPEPVVVETTVFEGVPPVAQIPLDVTPAVPQVVEKAGPRLRMVATRLAWVRVRSADGTTLYEGEMQPGDDWDVPALEEPPTLRVGDSGAVFFMMGEEFYGPVGGNGQVTSNVALAVDLLKDRYNPADPNGNAGLTRYAEAQAADVVTNE